MTVLALRALGLGDALTGVPALRALRRARPGERLVLAGPPETGELLVDHGAVDAVLPVRGLAPLTAEALVVAAAAHPDVLGADPPVLAVNLHGRGPQSTAALRSLAPERLVAFDTDDTDDGAGPSWDLPPAERGAVIVEHEVDRWFRLVAVLGAAGRRTDLVLRDPSPAERTGPVVVHPGAASGSRRWPAERWADVVAALRAAGRDVLVTGSAAESGLCSRVAAAGAEDAAGRLSLRELLDAVASAPLVLAGDTGVAHAATAVRTPSVLLFGPTDPARWGPAVDGERHRVLWPAPAGYRGDPHAAVCDAVLASTSVDDVLVAVRDLEGCAEPVVEHVTGAPAPRR